MEKESQQQRVTKAWKTPSKSIKYPILWHVYSYYGNRGIRILKHKVIYTKIM